MIQEYFKGYISSYFSYILKLFLWVLIKYRYGTTKQTGNSGPKCKECTGSKMEIGITIARITTLIFTTSRITTSRITTSIIGAWFTPLRMGG